MMSLSRTVGLLSAAMLASVMTGCSQARLADLPIHELNLADRGHPPRRPLVRTVKVDKRRPEQRSPGRQWRYIVIHHSASEGGNAEIFDRLHRGPAFGFDELGYHFVITNGRDSPDGAIEVGSRWHKQKWGAHCGGTPDNEYNNFGIGICLVGDFTDRMPTAAQLASLERLVVRLMADYNIPPENVIGHRDAPNASTECPGGRFSAYLRNHLRSTVAHRLAAASYGAEPMQ